jgi:non-ribosomal peptide synthase protein (TIGR01720 family)
MEDATMNDDLATRLAKLAPWQCQLLATALAHDPSAQPRASRLLAWIVPEADHTPTLASLRALLGAQLPDYMVPQQFIAADSLPRARSGKVDRAALRAHASGVGTAQRELQQAANGEEAVLADIWADVLGLDYVGVDEDFFELGGDSLLSIRILSRARRAGLALSPETFFAHPTVAAQARLASKAAAATTTSTAHASGDLPLTPISHWFFERTPVDPAHWNQCFEWQLDEAISAELVDRALRALLRHHDALRLCFTAVSDSWQARISEPDDAPPLVIAEVGHLRGRDLDREWERLATTCNTAIDLARAPLLRATLIMTAPGSANRLLIAVHHLGVDALSWRVLAEDLETAFRQLIGKRAISLPAPTASFQLWSQRLVEYAQTAAVCKQIDYWQTAVTRGVNQLPVDYENPPEANRWATAASVRLALGPHESAALGGQTMARRGAHVVEALLGALTVAMGRWRGEQPLMIDIEGHGRESLFDDLDVSRMLGWCTCVYPFLLEPGRDLIATVEDVVRRLRQVPQGGIGYGLLRYLNRDPAINGRLAKAPHSQLVFNYLGAIDAITEPGDRLTRSREVRAQARSARGLRAYAIEINAWFEAGLLQVDWQYSDALHRAPTVQSMVDAFSRALQDIVASGWVHRSSQPSAEDFPLAQLDESEFARLLGMLDENDAAGR